MRNSAGAMTSAPEGILRVAQAGKCFCAVKWTKAAVYAAGAIETLQVVVFMHMQCFTPYRHGSVLVPSSPQTKFVRPSSFAPG
jgi:hypothetical protein